MGRRRRGVNSDPNAPYVTPDTILIHITFSSPLYLMSQINIENFNPFIITNQRRGYEVHLPDYPPTDLVDQSVLGTFEDRSNPSTGKYYLTEITFHGRLILRNFAYPKATIDIINAYNHFVEWATSGGVVILTGIWINPVTATIPIYTCIHKTKSI